MAACGLRVSWRRRGSRRFAAERQRLQAAFGTYGDPALAARLLQQGDGVFTGERRQVTVMFVDIRDFTPFAEANTAEDTVPA
jgi:adenylate cyclase